MCATEKPIFRELTAEDPDPEATVIESLCMNCHANGSTRLLLTKIPHYREVVLMSFSCDECGYRNNEIQSGGAIAEKGVRYTLRVESLDDLDRTCVKSDHTSFKIVELDFEIPAQSQKGEVTTIEGIISRATAGLKQDQDARRRIDPKATEQIDKFIEKLEGLRNIKENGPFTVILEDASGNVYIENPVAPKKDPRCERVEFVRTKEQDHVIGVFTHEEVDEANRDDAQVGQNGGLLIPTDPEQHTLEHIVPDEIMRFRTNCPECNAPCDTNMKLTNIPHFKEVVIMATVCDACGNRTNEVKSGGGIEEKGVRFEIKVAVADDFSRDVLKSDTCYMRIPELELEVGPATLGGRFSTVEGLLVATRDQLTDGARLGDATAPNAKSKMDCFLEEMDAVLSLRTPVTLILDDPAGNSYAQSLSDDGPDERLIVTRYKRTYDQDEELGINDMKTEGYEKQ